MGSNSRRYTYRPRRPAPTPVVPVVAEPVASKPVVAPADAALVRESTRDAARHRFGKRRLWSIFAALLSGILAVGPQAFADEIPPELPELPEPPPAPAAEVPPGAILVDELAVDAASATGTDTRVPLVQTRTYLIESTGVVDYGNGNADAECANFDTQPLYKREWFTSAPNTVDLFIDNAGLEWTPVTADAENCNTSTHVYRSYLTPEATKTYNLLFNDPDWRGDNSGRLTVRVYEIPASPGDGVLIDSFSFSSANPAGGTSGVVLMSDTGYRIEVSGDFDYAPGRQGDAECTNAGGAWVSQDPLDAALSNPDVWVDGAAVTWRASRGRTGCDEVDHTYNLRRNGANAPVNLRVNDTWHGDNQRALAVRIYDVGDPIEDAGDVVPGVELPAVQNPADLLSELTTGEIFVEQFSVDSADPTPRMTTTYLAAGQIYAIESSGTVRFGPGLADAECANFDTQPLYKREWFTSEPHTADLLIDGEGIEWTPTVPDPQGCNTTDHKYTTYFVPTTTKRVGFLFSDGGWRGDNAGTLAVRIFQTDKVPPRGTEIDHYGFDSRDADGTNSTVSLDPNTSYRIKVQGTYGYLDGGSELADAECVWSEDSSSISTPGNRQDAPNVQGQSGGLDATGTTPDVILNTKEVSWVPTQGRAGCDERTHAYIVETAGLSGPINLRVRDTWHGDNQGLIEVWIFEIGPASSSPGSGLPVDLGEEGPALPNPEPPSQHAIPVDVLTVDSRSDTPVSTHGYLVKDQKYTIRASGVVQFGAGNADAECVNFAPLQPLYKREWFTAAPHTADLLIDGQGVEWTAATPDAEGCDTTDHEYTFTVTPATTKTYKFLFHDSGWRGDNSGSFTVEIFLTDQVADQGTLVDEYGLQAADADGQNSAVSLLSTHTYRIKVAGEFKFDASASTHDAECAYVGGAGPGDRQDVFDAGAGTPDVIVHGNEVDWTAMQGVTGCDETANTYYYDLSGVGGPFNLKVRDTWHGDNTGLLSVKVYDLGLTA